MLSSKTYFLWNFTLAVLTVVYAIGNITRGTYWLAIVEVVLSIIFLVYAGLAYKNKSIFAKHPVSWKPNGEPVATELLDKDSLI